MRISGSDAIIVMDNEVWYCIDGLPILLMFVKDFFPEVALKKGRTKLTRQIAGSEKMM